MFSPTLRFKNMSVDFMRKETSAICRTLCIGVLTICSGAHATESTGKDIVAPQPGQIITPKELNADNIIAIVLAHNPQLKAAQSARQSAISGIQTAQALPNPRVDWNQGTNTARLPGATSGTLQGWSITQPIENPAIRQTRIETARAFERENQHLVSSTRNDVVRQARLLIYQGLLHQAQAAASAEDVRLLEQVRERVRVRVDSGEAGRYEIIKADTEIITARERLQTTRLMVEQSKIQLNQLAAGQLPAQWQLVGDLNAPHEQPDVNQLQHRVIQHNPEINALQAEVDKASSVLQGAQSSRWPGLELRYSQNRDPEIRQGQWGVGMQIPLADQRSGPIAQASADLERSRIRLDGKKSELRQQVLLTLQSLDIARLRTEALSQGSVREAEAALRIAQAAYRFGERGILDVLDAQRVLRSVRASLLEARYLQQEAHITLDHLIGLHTEKPPL